MSSSSVFSTLGRSILTDCALSDRCSLPSGASFVSDCHGPVPLCHLSNWGGGQVFRNQNINIHKQLDLARHWGPLHKHATTPVPKEPGLEEVHGSSPTPPPQKQGHNPLKFEPLPPQNSRLQHLFPAFRPFPQPRSLALRRFVRAPATEHHLAEADHRPRDRRRHALELGLRSLLVAQPGIAGLP